MQRNVLIKLIHVGIRDRGLDEDNKRDLYKRTAGKDTLIKMTDRQLELVLGALKALGFRVRHKTPRPARRRIGQDGKITALWLELRDMGVLRDASDAALRKYVKGRTGVDRVEWLQPEQKSYVIEQLKAWIFRINSDQPVARAEATAAMEAGS